MSDKLWWPSASDLREAGDAGRQLRIEAIQFEREFVLTNWRNLIHDALVEAVDNNIEDESLTVHAPTGNVLLAKQICPILVAWLKNTLPGFQISGDQGDCVSICVGWRVAIV